MKISSTCTYYDPPDLIPSAWVIDYWLINSYTHVWSPLITTNVNVLKPNIVMAKLGTNAAI
jgi:hypothetical protein